MRILSKKLHTKNKRKINICKKIIYSDIGTVWGPIMRRAYSVPGSGNEFKIKIDLFKGNLANGSISFCLF